jgi:hypothetical protein
MKLIFAILAVVFLTSACSTKEKFFVLMDKYVGGPEESVMLKYGPPDRMLTLASGNRILSYTRSNAAVMPNLYNNNAAIATSRSSGSANLRREGLSGSSLDYNEKKVTSIELPKPPTVLTLSCTVNFLVSPKGQVISWDSSGNHCVSS